MLRTMKTDTSLSVPDDVEAYIQLQQQMCEALRREHPECLDQDGRRPTCEAYEARLAELLGVPSAGEYRPVA
jgi:hypothetical protein